MNKCIDCIYCNLGHRKCNHNVHYYQDESLKNWAKHCNGFTPCTQPPKIKLDNTKTCKQCARRSGFESHCRAGYWMDETMYKEGVKYDRGWAEQCPRYLNEYENNNLIKVQKNNTTDEPTSYRRLELCNP